MAMSLRLLLVVLVAAGCGVDQHVGSAARPLQLGGTYSHFCAVFDDGLVGCWGDDSAGELGDGVVRTTPFDPDPQTWDVFGPGVMVRGLHDAVEVSGGAEHSCARTRDGSMYCWGGNSHGQLGNGTTTTRLAPTLVGGLDRVVGISTGLFETCALVADGSVHCWGDNHAAGAQPLLNPSAVEGIIGATEISGDNTVTCVRLGDGSPRCWESTYTLDGVLLQTKLLPSMVDYKVESIVAHPTGGCAIDLAAGVSCWGGPGYGAAPTHLALPPVTAMAAELYRVCALSTAGDPWCWGRGSLTPALMQGEAHAVALVVGQVPLCFIREDGTIGCISQDYAHDITF